MNAATDRCPSKLSRRVLFARSMLAGLGLLLASACSPPNSPAPVAPTAVESTPADRITQVSVINALMLGRYDGEMSIADLLRHGDFGVGTLDHLDGELIVLDGKAYQVRGDGAIVDVPPDRSTPFATITPFEADGDQDCPKVESLAALDARLAEILPQKNDFVAVRIDGRFASLTLRSVHRQEPPYRPLAEVAKTQSMWTREDQTGTLLGIRSPTWTAGLNVPGFHWHFLSDDHKVGGHVLDCRILDARLRHDVCTDWLVKLDTSPDFNAADVAQDLRRELHRVESSRGGTDEPRP